MSERNRSAKDIGTDSPTSETAKQQGAAGASGGPQAARERPRVEKQPPQTSGRRDPAHEHTPSGRKGYDASENPDNQGDGEPGPETLRKRPSMQGHGGAGGGGRTTANEDVTQRSHEGEPAGGHTVRGRQRVPGDRDPQQPQ